ncbi:MAG TPA: glycosyltransferase family 9 protein, partial [Caldilineae bacterium]|nr:glycosyltransferase family 9 protein [Caldilineae bacterium]
MAYNTRMPPAYPLPPASDVVPPARVQLRRWLAGAAAHYARGRVRAPGHDAPRRVLLIRPDHLGDLLFLGPALHWLRQALPDTHLTLAIGPWGHPALPALAGTYDELLEIPFPAFERGQRRGLLARWRLLPQTAQRLRALEFDSALVFRPDHWWGAMLAALAKIPRRLGYDTAETTPWLTTALPLPHEHAAASNLRLAGTLLDQQPA